MNESFNGTALVFALIMGVSAVFMPLLIKKIFRMLGFPRMPQNLPRHSEPIVVDYVTANYAIIFFISTAAFIGLFSCGTTVLLHGTIEGGMIALLSFAFLPLACLGVMYARNRVVIIYGDCIVFKDFMGKVYYYTKDQIMGYYIASGSRGSRLLHIRTVGKKITIDSTGTNFMAAWDFIEANYPAL